MARRQGGARAARAAGDEGGQPGGARADRARGGDRRVRLLPTPTPPTPTRRWRAWRRLLAAARGAHPAATGDGLPPRRRAGARAPSPPPQTPPPIPPPPPPPPPTARSRSRSRRGSGRSIASGRRPSGEGARDALGPHARAHRPAGRRPPHARVGVATASVAVDHHGEKVVLTLPALAKLRMPSRRACSHGAAAAGVRAARRCGRRGLAPPLAQPSAAVMLVGRRR